MLSIIKTIALAGLLATPTTSTIVPKWMRKETACDKLKKFDESLNNKIQSMEHCLNLLDKFMPDEQCNHNQNHIPMQDIIACTSSVISGTISIAADNILGRVKNQSECAEISKKRDALESGTEEYCATQLSYAQGYCFKYKCTK